jgi:hypothetical protein
MTLDTATAPSSLVQRGRRVRLPALTLAGTAAGALVVHVIDPNQTGNYPTCPFLAATGFYCPGCGTLRCLHALTEGNLATALQRNPATVLTVVFLVPCFVVWTRRLWRGRERTWAAPAWVIWTLFWAILAYWGLRNVPGWTWLSPA